MGVARERVWALQAPINVGIDQYTNGVWPFFVFSIAAIAAYHSKGPGEDTRDSDPMLHFFCKRFTLLFHSCGKWPPTHDTWPPITWFSLIFACHDRDVQLCFSSNNKKNCNWGMRVGGCTLSRVYACRRDWEASSGPYKLSTWILGVGNYMVRTYKNHHHILSCIVSFGLTN